MKSLRFVAALIGILALLSCASQPKAVTQTGAGTAALEGQVADLQKQLDAKDATINDLTAQKKAVDDQLAAAQAEESRLQTQLSGLQDRIGSLQQEKAALDAAAQKSEQDLQDRIAQLRKEFAPEIASGDMDIKRYHDVLVVSVKESVFFQPDWPALLPGGTDVLQRLAKVFKQAPDRLVRVEGNTAVATSSAESLKYYPTSWHLGAARAANVVRYLQEQCGMDPLQLVASSLGQYRPKADNATEKGKAENRRVDFVLVARPLWEIDQLQEAVQ